MWFGLPDASHADETITRLADADHQTDWGMRIISSQSKVYDGSGYHYRRGVAAVHRMGVGRRISLPPGVSGLFEFAGECAAASRRRAGTLHRGSIRRLLPIFSDQFAAPDLVCGHGRQSDSARDVWPADRRGKASDHAGSACSGGLDIVRHPECTRRAGPVWIFNIARRPTV